MRQVLLIGRAEVIESNAELELLAVAVFAWAIPLLPLRLRTSFPIAPTSLAASQAVQGWNNVYDNNIERRVGRREHTLEER